MMDKRLTVVYADAAEKFVKNVVLYGNEGVLYYDEAHTEVVNDAELENLFLKGLVVKADNKYEVPTGCVVSESNVVINCGETTYTNSIVNEEEVEAE